MKISKLILSAGLFLSASAVFAQGNPFVALDQDRASAHQQEMIVRQQEQALAVARHNLDVLRIKVREDERRVEWERHHHDHDRDFHDHDGYPH